MVGSDLFAPSEFSKKRDNYETRLQIATVQYLQGQIRSGKNVIKVQKPFDCIFLHPVNEFKDKDEAFWGKAKGILPGAADLLFWWKQKYDNTAYQYVAKSGAIELKSKIGTLSPTQKDFKANFESVGGMHAICRKVSEVRDTLISWGIPCKNTNCLEPKLTHSELLAMQAEIYKR